MLEELKLVWRCAWIGEQVAIIVCLVITLGNIINFDFYGAAISALILFMMCERIKNRGIIVVLNHKIEKLENEMKR